LFSIEFSLTELLLYLFIFLFVLELAIEAG